MRVKFTPKSKYLISLISTARATDFKAIEGNMPRNTAQITPSGKSCCWPKFTIPILFCTMELLILEKTESHVLHKVQPEH